MDCYWSAPRTSILARNTHTDSSINERPRTTHAQLRNSVACRKRTITAAGSEGHLTDVLQRQWCNDAQAHC